MTTRSFGTNNMGLARGDATRPSMANSSGNAVKSRQVSQLNAQLAQLSSNLRDTDNLVRMTSVQAEAMRGLGSWHGGMFMAASKVLGEEAVARDAGAQQQQR
ncbi:DASH complex subunit Hsk3 like-domain-containing protein [Plectosphaerella plurivora]|uniref:DASH complex subunit Hsk3 like-domain-containing protein n=1 Tax=Plectosphaerella plurivora TaxID=936078 RepID=A0A9P9A5U0_9PEZI|nr:DASH complex subunit Hsk3 like-domain-containing protein [Plectosphaerella plurivora]